MSEKRFIQLINLYIDGEISPQELEELETEVGRDPRRREIYQSYCRLQYASQIVYNKFGSALTETVDLKKYHILSRDSGRQIRRGLVYSAGALVAACLTVVAAVSVFQDAEWGPSVGMHGIETAYGSVEIFEPRAGNRRSERGNFFSVNQSEPIFFAGRPESTGPAEFNPGPPLARDGFKAKGRMANWEGFSTNSSPKVIRGDASFEVGPEFASFQFQR